MSDTNLDACGCCAQQPCACPAGSSALNRPGLPAIRYRLGTYSSFRRELVDGLPGKVVTVDGRELRPLAPLTARNDDDPAIAMIDAFSIVCDVLTFYQERIANEGYLRTATERRSVLELAREIGYELAPGVSASTYLAFTVEDAPSAPKQALVPVGTKVQSVPGPGEQPQVFETMTALTVRADWNALPAQQTHLQAIEISGDQLVVDEVAVDELYLAGTGLNLKETDAILVVQGGNTLALTIVKLTEDAAANRTRVDVGPRLPLPIVPAPELPSAEVTQTPVAQTLDNVQTYILDQCWNEEDLQAFLTVQNWDAATMLTQVETLLAAQVPDAKVYTFRQRVGFFGANAPEYTTLERDGVVPRAFSKGDWDDPAISIWKDGTHPIPPPPSDVIY
ncbi:MAG: hypothetical protein ABJE66_12195 [Deltaproteobacteria bacterium]